MFTSDNCAVCGDFVDVERPIFYDDNGHAWCRKCQDKVEKTQQAENKERP